MAKAGPAVKAQRDESERIAAVLAVGGDPTTVPVPWAHKYLQGPVTLNQGLLAAINGSIATPAFGVTLGPEHGDSHHAPWGEPGQRITCLEAGRMALRAELETGLHGGREPWGYILMYLPAYALAAAHPDPECRAIGRRLLWGEIAVYWLLRGWTMGCRTGVVRDGNAVAVLDLLAGREPEIGGQDWQQGARIFGALMPVLKLPTIASDDEAAGVLTDSGARCLLGWDWIDYGGGVFGAAIIAPSGCIRKGTGEGVMMYFDGRTGRAAKGLPSGYRRSLTLGAHGVDMTGEWFLPDPPPPDPEPIPEEPTPEHPEEEEPEPSPASPTPEQIERARGIIRDAKLNTKSHMTARESFLVRQELQDALALLAGREPKP